MSDGGIDQRRVELLRLGLELGIGPADLIGWAKEAEEWLMPAPATAPKQKRSGWTPERRAEAAERMRAMLLRQWAQRKAAAASVVEPPEPAAAAAPAPPSAPAKPRSASTHPDAAQIAEHIREHGVTKLPARHAESEDSRYRG